MTGSQPPVNGGPRGEGQGGGDYASHGRVSEPPAALHSLDELVQTAKLQVPDWKSIVLEVPRGDSRTIVASVDTSIGGQPEKARQLVLDRQTGQVDAVKRFSDNVAGRRLRAYARFLHTGEEFGVGGETVAALASVGAVMLVWTGLSMALRRLMAVASGERRALAVVTVDEELTERSGM